MRGGAGGDQEVRQKHPCKLCSRSFPCGRSLGGHMRGHMASSSGSSLAEADGEPALPPRPHLQGPSSEWVPGFHGEGARYVLRENPKKTWRLHDSAGGEISPAPQEKLCKECGKGFPSWRALFDHTRCHDVRSSRVLGAQVKQEEAEEAGEDEEVEEDGDGDGSWGSGGAQKMLAVGMGVPRRGRVRARSRRVSAATAAAAAPSLSASEIRKELEDVALCLMMLSRDVGCWGGFHSIAASSDVDSAVPEEVEASAAIGDLRVCVPDGKKEKKNKIVPCVDDLEESDDGERSRDPAKRPRLRRALADLGNTNSKLERCHLLAGEKSDACKPASGRDHGRICDGGLAKPPHGKSSFECTTCGKAFGSYQALGGHQTSHNRAAKSCLAPNGGRENSVETAISTAAEEEAVHQAVGFAEEASSRSQKKTNHHECGICFKVFPSGQALGGHKRRHFSGNFGGPSASCRPTVAVQEQLSVEPRVFDLNLPAPSAAAAAAAAAAAGDSSAGGGQLGFRSWWVGSDHQGEPLVHLVSS